MVDGEGCHGTDLLVTPLASEKSTSYTVEMVLPPPTDCMIGATSQSSEIFYSHEGISPLIVL